MESTCLNRNNPTLVCKPSVTCGLIWLMVILLILRVFFPVTLLSFTETLSNGCFTTCVIAELNCLAGVKNNFNLGCRVASYPLLS